ncbi:hypothetical protein [Chitinimonas sp.]|uniref:hypothetical protein n=1 Tax=Chitinimonas sp. TaxID=1934313 RepID=UPI0035B3F63C
MLVIALSPFYCVDGGAHRVRHLGAVKRLKSCPGRAGNVERLLKTVPIVILDRLDQQEEGGQAQTQHRCGLARCFSDLQIRSINLPDGEMTVQAAQSGAKPEPMAWKSTN